jgi:hypothetical protein
VLADVDVSIIVPQRQPTPLLLGKGKASYTGEMWVTLPKPTVGQQVAAVQETADGNSGLLGPQLS